jgi:uncharacterized protein YgiM (DUF1202 family)
MSRAALAACAAGLLAMPAAAQSLDVPITVPRGDGQAADCATSYVAGLDPNGDGFLSVRSGPDSGYRVIDEVHNGDVVAVCDRRGDWVGVFYTGSNIGTGYRDEHAARSGWVHSDWLRDLAG